MQKRIFGLLTVLLLFFTGGITPGRDASAATGDTLTLSLGTVTFNGFSDTAGRYLYNYTAGSGGISNIDLEIPAAPAGGGVDPNGFLLTTSNISVWQGPSSATTIPSGTPSSTSWTPLSFELFAPGIGDSGTKLGTGDKRFYILKVNATSKGFPASFSILLEIRNQGFPLGYAPQVMLLKSGNGSVWDSGTINAPTRAALPVTATLTASPSSVVSGNPTTLTWNTSNATTVMISPGIGTVQPSGSQAVTPSATTTYTLVADGPGGTQTSSATVNVVPPQPTATISANPATIPYDGCTQLSWSATNSLSVSISSVGPVSSSPVSVCNLTKNARFTITATGDGGVATSFVDVAVGAAPVPSFTEQFTASPPTVDYNGSVTLKWGVTNATLVTITPFPGTVTGNSAVVDNLTKTITFTIVAEGPGGTETRTATVTVKAPPVTVSISSPASTTPIIYGECTNLTWHSTNAVSAAISSIGPVTLNSDPAKPLQVCPTQSTTYTITATGAGGDPVTASADVLVGAIPSPAIQIAQQTIEKKDSNGNVIGKLTFYFQNDTPACSCSTGPDEPILPFPCNNALPPNCSKAFDAPLLVCIPFPDKTQQQLLNSCASTGSANCKVVPLAPTADSGNTCVDPNGCFARCDEMTYVTRATDLEVGPHSCTCTTSTSYKYSTVTRTYVPVPVTTCTGTPCP